jgi:hypothetical protein
MGKKEFADVLANEREIEISFVRGTNGKTRTIPIWFAVEGGHLQLLPMYGLKTKWFQDIEKSGSLEVHVKSQAMKAHPQIVRDESKVERIKGVFAQKYGVGEVKKYYPMSEVALEIPL